MSATEDESDFRADLADLEALLAVFEELGAEDEPELEDLVTPYRRVHGKYDVLLRDAPFDGKHADEARVFLLSDAVLVGLSTKKSARRKGTQKRKGTLDRKAKKGTLTIPKGALQRFSGDFKLLHYLDVRNCRLRRVGEDAQGFSGIQLTHVSRVWDSTGRGNKAGKGTGKVVTKIAKLELWLPTVEQAAEVEATFLQIGQNLQREEEEEQEQVAPARGLGSRLSLSRASSNVSTDTGGEGKQRKWAAGRVRRSTLEKTLSDRRESAPGSDKDTEGSGSGSGGNGGALTERSQSIASSMGEVSLSESLGGGLQLSDLEKRYNMDLRADAGAGASTVLEVEFGEGRLGLSLGSGSGLGVIVGALAPGGFAEMAGVLISDRVCAINDEEIGLDDHWQDALEKLKTHERPINIRFERFAARADEIVKSNRAAGAAKSPIAKGKDTAGSSRAKAHELERILGKAERIVRRGDGMKTALTRLVESPAVTRDSNSRMSAAVLDEIARTELAYVNDLCDLVRTYVLPLRNERVKTKCRHIDGAGVLCEHGLRSTCLRSASEYQPLVSPAQLQGIFLNVETIMFVNIELLRLLQMRLNALAAGSKVPTLGDTILAFADSFSAVTPFFKSYSYFCHEYAAAVDRLLLLRKEDKVFGTFLNRIERAAIEDKGAGERRVQSLSSLLIKPVQRICKYPLLFSELLKHASADLPGLEELERAAEKVESIAESVNDKVGESRQFERFMEVYRDLGGEDGAPGLVLPSRRFITEVNVLVTESPFATSPSNARTLFIFNDLLILAKAEPGALGRGRSLKRISLQRGASSHDLEPKGGALERSWSRLLNVFGVGGGDTSREAARGRRSNAHGSLSRKGSASLRRARALKVTHRFELARTTVTEEADAANPAAAAALVVTASQRVLEEAPAEQRNERKGARKTEKWKTIVSKVRLSFLSEEAKDKVAEAIDSQVQQMEERGKAHLEGESKFGTKKERRGWAQKSSEAAALRRSVRTTGRR